MDLALGALGHKALSTMRAVRYCRQDCPYCWIVAACWDLTTLGDACSCRKGPGPWPIKTVDFGQSALSTTTFAIGDVLTLQTSAAG